MNDLAELNLKKFKLKLKTQEKQLQVVQGLVNRNSGYAKVQAEASLKRLTQEIADIKKDILSFEKAKKK